MIDLGLDSDQLRAASHTGGPAVVVAGPGAGKTLTLLGRHLKLAETGVPRESIMVSTFTVKAADQLRTRLIEAYGGLPPQEARRMAVGTFHSICAGLLRRFHAAAGLPEDFRILDTTAQAQLISSLGIRWEGAEADLIDVIARWKDSLKTPETASVEAAVRGDRGLSEAAEHFARYEKEKSARGAVDFPDLIGRLLFAMQQQPGIRRILQGRFTHLLIDEWQDVNALQIAFVKSVLGTGNNIWAVGDDDQGIYGWRGADVRYMIDFHRHFPGGVTYKLGRNYRSDPTIVSVSSAFVAGNSMRVRKSLVSVRKPGAVADPVVIRSFETDVDEARWVARSCGTLLSRGVKPAELAVLFRTTSLSPVIERIFAQEGVPAVVSGATPFWELPETLAVAAILSLASGRPDDGLLDLGFKSGRRRDELNAWVRDMAGTPYKDMIAAAVRAVGERPHAGLQAERLGLWLDASEQAGAEAKRFPDLNSLMAHIAAERDAPRKGKRDGIPLSTIHTAKGLEWQGIFICGCEAHMMPHHRSANVEEERRVLYVAMTRARAFVSLSYVKQRFSRHQAPSPFLHEIVDRIPKALAAVVWPARPPKPAHLDQ